MDPGKAWNGSIWRWYHEDMLDGVCRDLEYIRKHGMTIAEFACIARCHGCEVSLTYATPLECSGPTNYDAFKAAVISVCCRRPENELRRQFLVCSYRFES
mmetsp:Transcript_31752/g.84792  ORF Transcript_31752/g.84792 Transcript_31752/m.84792 type:complete len:100 (-) Transcript_31752:103-402(-)